MIEIHRKNMPSRSFKLGRCKDCGNVRMITINDGHYISYNCIVEEDDPEAGIKFIQHEDSDKSWIDRNITMYMLLHLIETIGGAVLERNKDENFTHVLLSTLKQLAVNSLDIGKISICKEKKGNYVIFDPDRALRDASESMKNEIEKACMDDSKETGIPTLPIPFELESTIQLGICPCCNSTIIVGVDKNNLRVMRDGNPQEKKSFSTEYYSEFRVLIRMFIGYEAIIRLIRYGTCFLTRCEYTLDALKHASSFMKFHVFDGHYKDDDEAIFYLMITDEGINQFKEKMERELVLEELNLERELKEGNSDDDAWMDYIT